MQQLVEFIVQSLVDNPDQVLVSETDGDNVTIIEVKVGSDDIGKVIGKEGRIANAIRTVAKAAAAKASKKISVEIVTD